MRAANEFIRGLVHRMSDIDRLTITLYGSLAFTGKRHGTDKAAVIGLIGKALKRLIQTPLRIGSGTSRQKVKWLFKSISLNFSLADDIIFNYPGSF